jgi:hypothetical protein
MLGLRAAPHTVQNPKGEAACGADACGTGAGTGLTASLKPHLVQNFDVPDNTALQFGQFIRSHLFSVYNIGRNYFCVTFDS